MRAIITMRDERYNPDHRKERHYYASYIGIAVYDGQAKEAVTLRLYSTEARHYAAIWVCGETVYRSGTGCASGYGYHRASAAAADAIRNAGIELSDDISGRGNDAIAEAVMGIVRAVYPQAEISHVVRAHA